MTDNDDRLIAQFMTEHKPQVADMGFTRRVMRHLPQHTDRLNRYWTLFCFAIGALAVAMMGSLSRLGSLLTGVMGDLVGAVAVNDCVRPSTLLTVVVAITAISIITISRTPVHHRREPLAGGGCGCAPRLHTARQRVRCTFTCGCTANPFWYIRDGGRGSRCCAACGCGDAHWLHPCACHHCRLVT